MTSYWKKNENPAEYLEREKGRLKKLEASKVNAIYFHTNSQKK